VKEEEEKADPEEVNLPRGGWKKHTIKRWYDDNLERISENYKEDFDNFYGTVNKRITDRERVEKKRALAQFFANGEGGRRCSRSPPRRSRSPPHRHPSPRRRRSRSPSPDARPPHSAVRPNPLPPGHLPPHQRPENDDLLNWGKAAGLVEGDDDDDLENVTVVFRDTLQAIGQQQNEVRQLMHRVGIKAAGPQIEALLDAIEALTGKVRAGAEKPEYRSAEAVVIEGIGKLDFSDEEPAEECGAPPKQVDRMSEMESHLDADIERVSSIETIEPMLEEILDVLESIAAAGPEYRTQIRKCERVLSELA